MENVPERERESKWKGFVWTQVKCEKTCLQKMVES